MAQSGSTCNVCYLKVEESGNKYIVVEDQENLQIMSSKKIIKVSNINIVNNMDDGMNRSKIVSLPISIFDHLDPNSKAFKDAENGIDLIMQAIDKSKTAPAAEKSTAATKKEPASTTKTATEKKAPASKPTAKKAAPKAAAKVPAKPAAKAPAKPKTSTSTTKKAPVKKAATKRAPAKKGPAKTTSSTKTSPKAEDK